MQVVIYAAKSTADPHESIPRQLDEAQREALARGWEVVGAFQDEGFSAFSGNRGPGFEQAKMLAIATAAEHGRCALLAQDSDRFARGAGDAPGAADHLLEVYFAMRRQNVELWTLRSGQIDVMRALLEGERSNDESRRKATNVPSGMLAAAKLGKASGGSRPFGFRYCADRNRKGVLEPVASEVPTVERIFVKFVREGMSLTAIARDIQRDGIETVRGARMWSSSTVARILGNPTYIGMIPFGGEVYEGLHDAIIDPELFEQAQVLLAARSSRGRGRPPKGSHLFTKGLLRCGACGEAYVPRSDHRRPGLEWYACNGHVKQGDGFCSAPSLDRAAIDTAVYGFFERVGLDVEATRAQFAGERDRRLGEIEQLIAQAEHAEAKADDALARAKRDYFDGNLSGERFSEFDAEWSEALAAARAEATRLHEQREQVEQWATMRDAEAEALRRLAEIRQAVAGDLADTDGIQAARAALSRLFSSFVVRVVDGIARVEPVVRKDAIDWADPVEAGEPYRQPVLRAVALSLNTRKRNTGLPSR